MADAIGRAEVAGVVLAGDAGVGKTRLGDECLAIAEKAGFTTARALATRATSTIPLGALAPLLPPASTRRARLDSLQRAATALVEQSGQRPLMLLVDDAHLLDPASAAVLHRLASSAQAFVVVTLRAGEAAPDPVVALWKDELALRIDVRPLTREETESLLERTLGGPVDGATAATTFRLAQGNPLYVRELVVAALDAGLLSEDGGVWRMPIPATRSPRLVELVEARLTDLDSRERAALEAVAFGEPVGLELLTVLSDRETVEALERRSLVVVELDGKRRQVRLAHPLHGDVVRAQAPRLRAMAVQRRLADALLTTGIRRREDALRLAVWSLENDAPVPPDVVLAAARQAHFAHDDHLAERLARAARDAGAGVAAGQVLGEVLSDLGRHEEADVVLGESLAAASSDDEVALAAMTLAETRFWGLGRAEEAQAVLAEVETRLVDDEWLGEVVGLRASYDLLAGRPLDALGAVSPLLERGAGRAFVQAGSVAAPALAIIGRGDEAIAVADAALAAHVGLGNLDIMGDPGIHLVSRVLALVELGRLAEAAATARAGYDTAVAMGSREGQAWCALILGRALWLTAPPTAARWFREGAAVFADLGLPGQQEWCLGGAALAVATVGDAAEARALLEGAAVLPSGHFGMMRSDVERARGWAAAAAGDLAGARSGFQAGAEIASEAGAASLESAALHDLARVGGVDGVVERLADAVSRIDGDLAPARAAHATALAGDDLEGLEAVTARFEEMDALVIAAEAAAQTAALHRRRGMARAAGRWAQRASDLGRRAGGVATPAMLLAGEAGRLTRRELEVARLAADGLSNAEIAERLFVSARTVENHLHRVYEKLGIAGRDDLATALTSLRASASADQRYPR